MSQAPSTALLQMREHFLRFVNDTSTFPTFLRQAKALANYDGEVEKLLPHVQRLQLPQGDAVVPPQEAQERRAAFVALDSFFRGLVEHPARVTEGRRANGATYTVQNASGSHAAGVGVSSSAGGLAFVTQPTIDTSLVGALQSPFGDLLVSNEKLENALYIEEELSKIKLADPRLYFTVDSVYKKRLAEACKPFKLVKLEQLPTLSSAKQSFTPHEYRTASEVRLAMETLLGVLNRLRAFRIDTRPKEGVEDEYANDFGQMEFAIHLTLTRLLFLAQDLARTAAFQAHDIRNVTKIRDAALPATQFVAEQVKIAKEVEFNLQKGQVKNTPRPGGSGGSSAGGGGKGGTGRSEAKRRLPKKRSRQGKEDSAQEGCQSLILISHPPPKQTSNRGPT